MPKIRKKCPLPAASFNFTSRLASLRLATVAVIGSGWLLSFNPDSADAGHTNVGFPAGADQVDWPPRRIEDGQAIRV
jgi:hypothetical protein